MTGGTRNRKTLIIDSMKMERNGMDMNDVLCYGDLST